MGITIPFLYLLLKFLYLKKDNIKEIPNKSHPMKRILLDPIYNNYNF